MAGVREQGELVILERRAVLQGTAAQQLDELERGTVDDLTSSVNRINMLTSQIAASNQAIATYQGIGHAPNDLLDQRDQLVQDLNKLVQVNTVEADDGSLSVFMGGGQVLVLSNRAETLGVAREAQPDGSSLARVALLANGTSRTLPQEQITGGAVKGLLQVQDVDVAQTRVALNTFVANFIGENNTLSGTVETIEREHCTVRLGDGSVIDALPVNVSKPGDRTLVSIRPERVEFREERMAAYTHKLEAEVIEFIYMGDSYRTRLNVAGNNDFIMKCRNAIDQRRLAPGEKVVIGWHVADCRALEAV